MSAPHSIHLNKPQPVLLNCPTAQKCGSLDSPSLFYIPASLLPQSPLRLCFLLLQTPLTHGFLLCPSSQRCQETPRPQGCATHVHSTCSRPGNSSIPSTALAMQPTVGSSWICSCPSAGAACGSKSIQIHSCSIWRSLAISAAGCSGPRGCPVACTAWGSSPQELF